jgi:hypothetical protein
METIQITTESGNEALVSTTSIWATRDRNWWNRIGGGSVSWRGKWPLHIAE